MNQLVEEGYYLFSYSVILSYVFKEEGWGESEENTKWFSKCNDSSWMITPSYLYFLKHVIFYQVAMAYTASEDLRTPLSQTEQVGQKPTKGKKFPKFFLLVSSLSRNPENHFQTHPRIKALPPNEKLKLHRLFHLLSSLHRYYFLKTPNSCPWQQSFS